MTSVLCGYFAEANAPAVFVALAMAASRKAGTSPESASGVLVLLGSSQNH